MKFPSIKNLTESIVKTLQRFPFEVLFALTGTIAGTVNIELSNINRIAENLCVRTMMIGNLGLLLSLAATLFVESKGIVEIRKWYLKILSAIVSISLLFIIDPAARQSDYMRFFLLSLSFHLLVAYAAFTIHGHIQGFWQFNKTLFLRFLTGVLYAIVLFIGLSAAIGAMNFLFGFKFEWDTFAILWVWIVGMFSTVFFLAGVPGNLKPLDEDTTYPKGLKIFTQYVLIPLATVYVLILLAYEIKILFELNLPKGLVSNIILGYAVFGILALLLVYPIREQEENKWLKTYARSFYFLLLPLLGLLFVAVGTRVFRYGITEYRYFLILLAVWLLFISVYFLFFKKQNIKLIPISLSILTLLSAYGPQSAFSISLYSQRRVLINFFKKYDAYQQGKLKRVTKDISFQDGNRAVNTLQYLIYNHDISSLQPYIDKDLKLVSDSIGKKRGRFNRDFTIDNYELRERKLDWAKNYLGLEKYDSRYNYSGADTLGLDSKYTYRFKTKSDVISVMNYDYMVDVNGRDTGLIKLNGINFHHNVLSYTYLTLKINDEAITFRDDELATMLLKRNDLSNYSEKNNANSLENNYVVPPALLTLTKQLPHYTITLLIDNFEFGHLKNGSIKPMYVAGVYLIKTNHK